MQRDSESLPWDGDDKRDVERRSPPVRADDSEATIIERIRAGESNLYEALVRRYSQRMYRVARAFLHEDEGVEDVMQEAYLKAFTALPRFKGRALFSTWLIRILINCAQVYLRTRSRQTEVPLDTVDTKAAEEGGNLTVEGGEQELTQEQIRRLIEKTIDALPARYRAVFVMRELEEMSIAETAAALGISPVNAKVRFHRAKRLLREGLRRQMPGISPYGFFGERCDALTKRVMEKIAFLRK